LILQALNEREKQHIGTFTALQKRENVGGKN
jgi:hypothetical protein